MNAQSFFGYLLVSGVCLLLNNAVLIIADFSGCTLLVSVLLSYAIVVVAGYLLHSVISFRRPFGHAAFGRYALAMATNVPLLFAITWLWRDVAGLPMRSAAPLATTCMVLINFVLGRWAILGSGKAAGTWTGQ